MKRGPKPRCGDGNCPRCGCALDGAKGFCNACRNAYNRAWRALERKRAVWRRNLTKSLQEPDFGLSGDSISRERIEGKPK